MSAVANVYEVTGLHDRFWVCAEARRFAARAGLRRDAQARLVLCVAELASNLAKHAGVGVIGMTVVSVPRAGVCVRAEDRGPGIACVADAMCDGFSEGRWMTPDDPSWMRRGLGAGLGAIARVMSDVRVQARVGGGLVVEATLWKHL